MHTAGWQSPLDQTNMPEVTQVKSSTHCNHLMRAYARNQATKSYNPTFKLNIFYTECRNNVCSHNKIGIFWQSPNTLHPPHGSVHFWNDLIGSLTNRAVGSKGSGSHYSAFWINADPEGYIGERARLLRPLGTLVVSEYRRVKLDIFAMDRKQFIKLKYHTVLFKHSSAYILLG